MKQRIPKNKAWFGFLVLVQQSASKALSLEAVFVYIAH